MNFQEVTHFILKFLISAENSTKDFAVPLYTEKLS